LAVLPRNENATQFSFFKAAPGNALKMRRLEDASVNPSKGFTLKSATQLKGEDFQ